MSQETILLNALFGEIRDATRRGDQKLADALTRVLSRAGTSRGFGSGDGLERFRRPSPRPDQSLTPRGYEAARRDLRAARRLSQGGSKVRHGSIPREPAPVPLPRAGGFRPSPVLRRPTFTAF